MTAELTDSGTGKIQNEERGGAPTFSALFEYWAKACPGNTALIFENGFLTYDELNCKANQLARVLLANGARPEKIIAIALPRSLEMVITILATLKTGAAYLPLDLDYPAERIEFMLQDAKPVCIVTATCVAPVIRNAIPQLLLDDPCVLREIDSCSDANFTPPELVCPADPENVAYMIYTSGSTGKPKGVLTSHAGLHGLAKTQTSRFGLTPSSRVLQFSSPSFDASVWDLCMALLSGAALVIAPAERLTPGDPLYRLVREQSVTHMLLAPSVLGALTPGSLECQNLFVAGEASSGALVERWSKHHTLWNAYGPTESTVCATISEPLCGTDQPAIGRGIQGTEIYLLDDSLGLVSTGEPGELYIAGAGLARGYANQSGLTAERFIANPFGAPGSRMYRTGDIARWNRRGELDYLGRTDEQIKIRGFRIEPAEIESALCGLDGVLQAAVIERLEREDQKLLVAYIVPHPGACLKNIELKRELARVLPSHMIPGAILVLDRLPLSPNGKLDRKALPAPVFSSHSSAAPSTSDERKLSAIFARLLNLPGVGRDDDFFELGGNSLLAAQLIGSIHAEFQVEIPFRTIFDHATVAALALQLPDAQPLRFPLVPQPRNQFLPLSFSQQRLWFLYLLEGPSPTYNVPLAIRLKGRLDPFALQDALQDLITRHEPLRTVFSSKDDTASQAIFRPESPEARIQLNLLTVDCNLLAATLTENSLYAFNLMEEIPLRATLIRLKTDEHVLLLLLHHMAADGASLKPLSRDFGTAYQARLEGSAPAWLTLPVQYSDYALWQRRFLEDNTDGNSLMARQLAFWRKHLAALPEEIQLPRDRARTLSPAYRGARFQFSVPASDHVKLAAVAGSTQATLFMVLHAALCVVLSKLGAGDDIVIGTPVGGRTEQALENLVGFFVNSIVLRTEVPNDSTFKKLLANVRERDLDTFAQQDVPFERLVEDLKPERVNGRHPLFQVMLTVQSETPLTLSLPGLIGTIEPVALGVARFDLCFNFEELAGAGGGLSASIDYATELFDEETVAAFAQGFLRVVSTVADDPSCLISSMGLVSDEQLRTLLEEWNRTRRSVGQPTLVAMMEAAAFRHADRIAIAFGDRNISYGELNRQANRLAHWLLSLQLPPESVVGVCLPRSPEQIVSLIAILKAGAVYFPLDPAYPEARLQFLLNDAAPVCVLARDTTARLFQSNHLLLLSMDHPRMHADLEQLSDANPTCRTSPENAAYLIYTSGSAGNPKGVTVTHVGLPSMASFQADLMEVNVHSRVLQLASSSFDASISEIAMALVSGATLVLPDADDQLAGDSLAALVRQQRITHLTVVPSVLSTLPVNALDGCTHLISAGEACSSHLARQWSAGRKFFNAYGPTETTVCATMTQPKLHVSGQPPIGKPIWNTEVYVLDSSLQPVLRGVVGELYIAGDGIARGYRNLAALTAQRFLANPFGAAGSRMYRTGDLVRWNRSGELEFVGRSDLQIKLRGLRIEPGEIEAILCRCGGAAQAAVVADGERLIAYVVPQPGVTLDEAKLRIKLASNLPVYMIPSRFVQLAQLPLTPNGKLDRKKLPQLSVAPGAGEGPRNPREETLVRIFADLLGLPALGIDENFFELGGHSLLAVRLVSRIKARFGLELPLSTIFEAPTVRKLMAHLAVGVSALVKEMPRMFPLFLPLREPVSGRGTRPPIFCIHPAGGIGGLYANLVPSLDEKFPLYAIQARGLDPHELPATSIEEMAQDYADEIYRRFPEGPYYLLGWSLGGVIAHAVAARLQQRTRQVELLAVLDSVAPGQNQTIPTDAEIVSTFTQFFYGHEPDLVGVTPPEFGTLEQMLAYFKSDPDHFQMADALPVLKIADFLVRQSAYLDGYRPPVFDGDLLFFDAIEREPGEAATPIGWSAMATGRLNIVPVNCKHMFMMQPEPLCVIGTVLNTVLHSLKEVDCV